MAAPCRANSKGKAPYAPKRKHVTVVLATPRRIIGAKRCSGRSTSGPIGNMLAQPLRSAIQPCSAALDAKLHGSDLVTLRVSYGALGGPPSPARLRP